MATWLVTGSVLVSEPILVSVAVAVAVSLAAEPHAVICSVINIVNRIDIKRAFSTQRFIMGAL